MVKKQEMQWKEQTLHFLKENNNIFLKIQALESSQAELGSIELSLLTKGNVRKRKL